MRSKSLLLRRSVSLQLYEEVPMAGKTVAITNANCGIGFQVARNMARRNARLILITCTKEGGLEAKERILMEKSDIEIACFHMNSAELASVSKCAQKIKFKNWPIHRLILTDNVYNPLHRITDDQFESTFQINYLANFYFITLLSPVLLASSSCRIIVISSEIHRLLEVAWPSNPKLTWKVLSPTHRLHLNSPLQAYLISTWCNRLMVRKLNSVFSECAVTAYAVHPGLMRSENEHELEYARNHGRMYRIFSSLLKSTEEGAASIIYCATASGIDNQGGYFFGRSHYVHSSLHQTRDDQAADRLWGLSKLMLCAYLQQRRINDAVMSPTIHCAKNSVVSLQAHVSENNSIIGM